MMSIKSRFIAILISLGTICLIGCAENHGPIKTPKNIDLEIENSKYINQDITSRNNNNIVPPKSPDEEPKHSDEPIFDDKPVGGVLDKDYVCDMRNAPMCRQTKIMPPNTNCSELTDDRDCNVGGKIPGKYCRLFGVHDCRQVTTCSDLTALGQQGCHGEMLGRLFVSPDTKFCAWEDQECREVATMPPQTECSALPDAECEVPNKIPGVDCRLFSTNGCKRVGNCEDLTPLGRDGCKDSVGSAHCGWGGDACWSYYH
ncbi:MAG: hypothetical protein ACREGC_03150 [Minisyncoccia bacterium]